MTEPVLSAESLRRLEGIRRLSRVLNGPSKDKHTVKILEMMRNLIEEIGQLLQQGDMHVFIETGVLGRFML